jgi:hypothetical protein
MSYEVAHTPGAGHRVIDEVAKVIEPAIRIIDRPLVQLRLHRVYPYLGLDEARPRCAGIHQRPPRAAVMPRTRWTPSPCDRLSRPQTTTGPPPHPGGVSRQRTFPAPNWQLAAEGTAEMVPTSTPSPFDKLGAQLCPCSLATPTPQTFSVASRSAT